MKHRSQKPGSNTAVKAAPAFDLRWTLRAIKPRSAPDLERHHETQDIRVLIRRPLRDFCTFQRIAARQLRA